MYSGGNGDRKNVSVINDNLKSSASKVLCVPDFSHVAVSARLVWLMWCMAADFQG